MIKYGVMPHESQTLQEKYKDWIRVEMHHFNSDRYLSDIFYEVISWLTAEVGTSQDDWFCGLAFNRYMPGSDKDFLYFCFKDPNKAMLFKLTWD